MDDCDHTPRCPVGTSRWNCCRRTEIERAMFRGDLDREEGERLLRLFQLPVRPPSATERYNREQRRIEKGLLF